MSDYARQLERQELARLRAENEKLRSALKVIHTWAKVDTFDTYATYLPCLKPLDVMKLCNEALGMEKPNE